MLKEIVSGLFKNLLDTAIGIASSCAASPNLLITPPKPTNKVNPEKSTKQVDLPKDINE